MNIYPIVLMEMPRLEIYLLISPLTSGSELPEKSQILTRELSLVLLRNKQGQEISSLE
jgi:hypothetical protein